MYGRTTRGVPEAPTTERYVESVVTRVPVCQHHPGERLSPCHQIFTDRPGIVLWSVCDARARQAGFVGQPKALAEPNTKKQWVRLART